MKLKIFKLCTVILLSLFMGASCQKDEWEEIILSDKTCGNVVGVLDSFTDYSGTVKDMFSVIGTNTYCIAVSESGTSRELLYIACNLPEQYHQNGLKIVFSGNVLNIKELGDGEAQSDLIGTPVQLTNAKIKK